MKETFEPGPTSVGAFDYAKHYPGEVLGLVTTEQDVYVVIRDDQGYRSELLEIADSDGDGLPGWWEQANNYNDNDAEDASSDEDDDTLTLLEEFSFKTDPKLADTDRDGLSDSQEALHYQTNPLYSDSDFDGLDDLSEIDRYGSDPLLIDSDGDWLPDGYEVANNLSWLNADESQDPDGDGYTNRQEFTLSTDPQNSSNLPSTADYERLYRFSDYMPIDVQPENAKTLWQKKIPWPGKESADYSHSQSELLSVSGDQILIYADLLEQLFVFDINTGEQRWVKNRKQGNNTLLYMASDNQLFYFLNSINGSGYTLVGIDQLTGERVFETEKFNQAIDRYQKALLVDDVLFFTFYDRHKNKSSMTARNVRGNSGANLEQKL